MKKIREKLGSIIEQIQSSIPMEAINEVNHFYSNAEYEIALEGLIIELIKENVLLNQEIKNDIHNMALELELDKEQILDCDIWPKFVQWYEDE